MRSITGFAAHCRATTSLCATGAIILAAFAMPAAAQDAPAPQDQVAVPEDDAQPPEITVTGSRIERSGFVAPTPTSVVTAEELGMAGVATIGDIALKLPQFRSGRSSYATHTGGNVGGNYFNLRGLSGYPGPSRTLTLVDGRRPTPTGNDESFDVNVIPSGIIDRVEIVTGGASAAYGSDAVAGVVNILLRKDLEGIEGSLQGGQTFRYADAREIKGTLSYGTRFADDRGHLMLSGEYYDNSGIGQVSSRKWAKPNWGLIANPAYVPGNGQPAVLLGRDARMANATYGGLIVNGALKGTQFLPGGIPAAFNPGIASVGAAGTFGGDGPNVGATLKLLVPTERITLFGRASYDLSDDVTAWVEGGYARLYGDDRATIPSFNFGNIIIQRDNAYLPESLRNAMAVAGQTNFAMSRLNSDFGFYGNSALSRHRQASAGLAGKFGDGWKWDVSASYGKYDQRQNYVNDTITRNLALATDAVLDPASGRIVCRSTLTAPGNGCVPINLFGSGSPSQQAIDYVTDDFTHRQRVRQTSIAASIQGEPFSLWAGPVSIAVGGEYRDETVSLTVAPLTAAFGHGIFNGPSAGPGTIKVKEAFAETVVPLLRDVPFFKRLDLNGAIRVTDYNTTGTVATWKVGITNEITSDLRLRATLSRDIRAPNFSELAATGAASYFPVIDLNGEAVTVAVPTNPNPLLKPEIARTLTVGLGYQPSWAGDLRISVDYYDIKIDGAITTLTAQQIINGCRGGQADLCSRLVRDGAGKLTQVINGRFNAQTLKTNGIDIELYYSLPLERISADMGGKLSFRGSASYTDSYESRLMGQVIQSAGVIFPHWNATGAITYSNAGWDLQLSGQYVGSVQYNGTPGSSQPIGLGIDKFPDRFYLDASFQHQLVKRDGLNIQIFGNIENLLDKAPPIIPSFVGPVSPIVSNYTLYDPIGRRFTLGVRFKL